MELTYDNSLNSLSSIIFPDWSFSDAPKEPIDIKETIILMGSSSNSINIIGTVDQRE